MKNAHQGPLQEVHKRRLRVKYASEGCGSLESPLFGLAQFSALGTSAGTGVSDSSKFAPGASCWGY